MKTYQTKTGIRLTLIQGGNEPHPVSQFNAIARRSEFRLISNTSQDEIVLPIGNQRPLKVAK